MPEQTINQRLRFLVETLATSTRAFSEALGESSGNTQNYIGARQIEPKHDYLAKVLKHFSTVNANWLMTGDGEPFLSHPSPTETNSALLPKNKNFSHSQVIGTNAGSATQNQGKRQVFVSHTHDDTAHLQALVEQLRSQLADKERTIQILLNQQPKP